MIDTPSPLGRKLSIGALIALVVVVTGVSAGVAISIVALENFSISTLFSPQETQEAQSTPPETQATPQETQEAQSTSPETQAPSQETQEAQSIAQGVQLVDIIPSPRIVNMNGAGDSQRLNLQGLYSDGSIGEFESDSSAALSFTSSDSEVAQVNSEGVVTSLKTGEAEIAVAYDGLHSIVPVLVWRDVRSMPPIDPERLLWVNDGGSAIVLNRVMVRLETAYGPEDASQLAAIIGGEVIFEFRTFPGYVIDFDAHTKEGLDAVLAQLEADERVTHVYPDVLVSTSQDPDPHRIETLANVIPNAAYLNAGMDVAWNLINDLPDGSLDDVKIVVVDLDFPSSQTNNAIADAAHIRKRILMIQKSK